MQLPTHLSPEATLARLDVVFTNELSSVAEGLALIALVDERRDYLAAGYSCMKAYCTRHMRMTEDVAAKRIQAARTAQRFPHIFDLLAKGELTVTAVVVLSPRLTDENADELLALAAGRTRSEIQFLLETRTRRPEGAPALDMDGASASDSPEDAPGHPAFAGVSSNSVTRADAADAPGQPAPPATTRRERIAPSADGACEVRLTLTPEERAALDQVQALASHTEWGGDPALVYARAIELLTQHLLKQKLGTGSGDAAKSAGKGRRVPMPVKFEVWKRDGGSCSFVGADGHRCGETRFVDFDHIVPVALGGKSTVDNVRLLCRAHNHFEAERVLGKEYVEERRELAQRERARDKAAASRTAARAAVPVIVRDEAHQQRHDDIVATLRALGCADSICRAEAAKADAWPNDTLEECVKRLLGPLSSESRARGERRAMGGT